MSASHDLPTLVERVVAELARFDEACGPAPKFGIEGFIQALDVWWKRWNHEEALMMERLQDVGAAFSHVPPHDHAVRLGGVRASSTSSFSGALHNWKRNAEKRIAAGRVEA